MFLPAMAIADIQGTRLEQDRRPPLKNSSSTTSDNAWHKQSVVHDIIREEQRGVENSGEGKTYDKPSPKTVLDPPTYDTFPLPPRLFTPCEFPLRKRAQSRQIPLSEASKTSFGGGTLRHVFHLPKNRTIRFAPPPPSAACQHQGADVHGPNTSPKRGLPFYQIDDTHTTPSWKKNQKIEACSLCFRGFAKGLAGGAWRPTAPKI